MKLMEKLSPKRILNKGIGKALMKNKGIRDLVERHTKEFIAHKENLLKLNENETLNDEEITELGVISDFLSIWASNNDGWKPKVIQDQVKLFKEDVHILNKVKQTRTPESFEEIAEHMDKWITEQLL